MVSQVIWLWIIVRDMIICILRVSGLDYPKGSTVRDTDWQVGNDGEKPVCGRRFKGEVVGYLVDGEEEILISSGADDVGCEEEGSGEDSCISKACCAYDLKGDDSEHNVLGQWLDTAKLEDLVKRND